MVARQNIIKERALNTFKKLKECDPQAVSEADRWMEKETDVEVLLELAFFDGDFAFSSTLIELVTMGHWDTESLF